jgi:two-component system chemotaxis response regulator CheB
MLARAGKLPVVPARHGERIQTGQISLASPDHHLVLGNGIVQLVHGPRENRCRPAIDVLFRSAAQSHGPRVIGVLLTGLLDDGTAGLLAIKRAGGIAIVQDPSDALFGDMPRNALETVAVDYQLPLAEIPRVLSELSGTSVAVPKLTANPPPKEQGMESQSHCYYSCPDCGGVLREIGTGDFVEFRCHVGHAFSTQALLEAQDDGLEYALWAAVRILEEKVNFYRRLARRHSGGRLPNFTQSVLQKADEAEKHAAAIRRILETGVAAKNDEPPGEMSRH